MNICKSVHLCQFILAPGTVANMLAGWLKKHLQTGGGGYGGEPNGGMSWTERGCDIGGPCCLCQDSLVVWVSVRAGAGLTVLWSANSRVAKEAGSALLAQLPLGVVLAALHTQQICV